MRRARRLAQRRGRRLRIRDHKGLNKPIHHLGHDLKLGRGGIREIEFFTQTRQIIAGGRDPDLRVSGTIEGLKMLSAKGWPCLDWGSSSSVSGAMTG